MASTAFQSREEARRARELEEARKLGTAPAEKDEEGRDINPHIPQYISRAPWYLNEKQPGLKHQRYVEEKRETIHTWYRRGVLEEGQRSRKLRFERGSCPNCGSKTHAEKDCTDRPRARKAKFTHKDLAPDEVLAEAPALSYDAKRDRYGGYTGDDFKWVVREHEQAQLERKRQKEREQQELLQQQGSAAAAAAAEKQRRKQQRLLKKQQTLEARLKKQQQKAQEKAAAAAAAAAGGAAADEAAAGREEPEEETDTDSDTDGSDEEDVKIHDFDSTSAPVACKDERSRINTRDLRIREDTAKYLFNLDLGSAFYDPKSRSMRDDPFKHISEKQRGPFKGDNALLQAGEVKATQQLQLFAWEAYKHGQNVHFNAQPTQLEFLYKEHQKKKTDMETQKQRGMFEKYGGDEHLQSDPRILYAQTEAYVEYSRDGTVLKGRERALTKSKYEEDIFPGNHTSVWGSYFNVASQKWGFACCCQTNFKADCTGRIEDNITLESLGLVSDAAAAAGSAARPAAAAGAAGADDSESPSQSSKAPQETPQSAGG